MIFVAEVASTFNEELLSHHLLENARDDRQRAYLINREIDDIRGTIVRQTMFAEFEKITHEMAEAGEPLTVQGVSGRLSQAAGGLFRPASSRSTTSCRWSASASRTSTGRSTSISTPPACPPRSPSASACCSGGKKELDDYLSFLKGGCSKDPLDLLRDAGVDMEQPEPVETALKYFGKLVEELDELL